MCVVNPFAILFDAGLNKTIIEKSFLICILGIGMTEQLFTFAFRGAQHLLKFFPTYPSLTMLSQAFK